VLAIRVSIRSIMEQGDEARHLSKF
jgi:hypothetical protein